jgi:hypothetical protein
MKQSEIIEAINAQQSIILDREGHLTTTDYIAAKIAEGKATKDEYADKIAERQQWRDDINAANAEIERLRAIENDSEDEPMPDVNY